MSSSRQRDHHDDDDDEAMFKIFKSFATCLTFSQILKPCRISLSHFPNILAISQISKSFPAYLRSLSNI